MFLCAYWQKKSQGGGVVARPEFLVYNPYLEEPVRFQNRFSADHFVRQTINQFDVEADVVPSEAATPVHYDVQDA